MTLEEVEAQSKSPQESDDETVICEWVAAEEDKAKQNKKVKACVDKVFKCLFGKNHQNLSGKERVTKIISKAFDVEAAQVMEDDLFESLNLLEDSLLLMERILSKHPQLMGVDLVNQMEEISEHIEQWGMGEKNAGTTIKLD
jgi:hypothetical protein